MTEATHVMRRHEATRRARIRAAFAGALWMSAAATLFGGCTELATDCARLGTCEEGGAATTGPGSGGGGQGGGLGCASGAAPADGGCVDEAHGIFVRSDGSANGEGTRADPVRSFAVAADLAKEQGKVVFACAETFSETTQRIPAGVILYGGLGCDDWAFQEGERTVLTAVGSSLATPLPLELLPAGPNEGPATLVRFEIVSPDAEIAGTSSVAVRALAGSRGHFSQSVIRAGRGADGVHGQSASATPAAAGDAGEPGKPGGCGNASFTNTGGAATANGACSSVGGKGGDFVVASAGSGTPQAGSNGQPVTATTGRGAPAEPTSGTWSCSSKHGADGAQGGHGLGGTGEGAIVDARFVGAAGADGSAGAPGQGGGGGGARRTPPGCPTSHNYAASGGSGGAGGCGGAFGRGGAAGGASIAILSLDAELTFHETEVRAGAGGKGGDGGDGQLGGPGGPGGSGGDGSTACARGGDGGHGGDGGGGGGGRGGHSIGILYVGLAPVIDGATIVTGTNGLGGAGGAGSPATSAGAPGLAQPTLAL